MVDPASTITTRSARKSAARHHASSVAIQTAPFSATPSVAGQANTVRSASACGSAGIAMVDDMPGTNDNTRAASVGTCVAMSTGAHLVTQAPAAVAAAT